MLPWRPGTASPPPISTCRRQPRDHFRSSKPFITMSLLFMLSLMSIRAHSFDASMLSFTGLTGSQRVSQLWSKLGKPQSTKQESSKKEASNQVPASQVLPELTSSHQKLFEQQPAYKYKDLQGPYEIRILQVSPAVSEDDTICCSIVHASIGPDASILYQALSYA